MSDFSAIYGIQVPGVFFCFSFFVTFQMKNLTSMWKLNFLENFRKIYRRCVLHSVGYADSYTVFRGPTLLMAHRNASPYGFILIYVHGCNEARNQFFCIHFLSIGLAFLPIAEQFIVYLCSHTYIVKINFNHNILIVDSCSK